MFHKYLVCLQYGLFWLESTHTGFKVFKVDIFMELSTFIKIPVIFLWLAESVVLFVSVWCICCLKDRFPEWRWPSHLEDRWKSSAAEVCPIWTGWQDPLQEYIYSEYPVQLGQNLSVRRPQVVWLTLLETSQFPLLSCFASTSALCYPAQSAYHRGRLSLLPFVWTRLARWLEGSMLEMEA